MKIGIIKRGFCIFCLLFCLIKAINLNVCHAQIYDPPLRLEMEVEENKFPYHLRLLGENGLVLISRTDAKDV